MMKKMRNRKKKGFTMIELIVVIAIIGILVLIAVPRFSNMTNGANERTFEANHRIVVSAVNMFVAENSGALPADNAALAPHLTGGVMPAGPNGATYTVANGVVTSNYAAHRTVANQTLVFTP